MPSVRQGATKGNSRWKRFCFCIRGKRRKMYEEGTFCTDEAVETERDKKSMKYKGTVTQGQKRQRDW